MKKIKHVLDYGICFLLFFCVLLASASAICLSTVFSADYMLSQYKKTDYLKVLHSEICETYDSFGAASGLPAEFFDDNIVDYEIMKTDALKSVESAYKGEVYTPDKEALEAALSQKVLEYSQINEIEIDKSSESAIKSFARLCVNEYTAQVTLPYASKIAVFLNTYKAVFYIILGISLVLTVLIILWMKKRFRWTHNVIRNASYAVTGAGLVLFIFFYYFDYFRIIPRLGISTRSFYMLVVSYLTEIMDIICYAGIAFMIMGAILAVLYFVVWGTMNKRKKTFLPME